MLRFVPVARLAPHSRSPFRERREVFFASTGGSANPEGQEQAFERQMTEMSAEVEARVATLARNVRSSEYAGLRDIEDLWRQATETERTVAENLATCRAQGDQTARYEALLRAQQALAAFETAAHSLFEESTTRRELRDAGIAISNRIEVVRRGEEAAYGKRRQEAIDALEAARNGTQAEKDTALADARRILAGLRLDDAGLERERQQEIGRIIQDTRTKLKDLLPRIGELDALKDPVLSEQFFDAGRIVADTHAQAEALLGGAEKADRKPSDERLIDAERAQRKAEKLERFLEHIESAAEAPMSFTQEQIADPEFKRVEAYYSRKNRRIAINPSLEPEKRQSRLEHEKRHLYLHALEGLDRYALARLYERVKNRRDPDGVTFQRHLERLTGGETLPEGVYGPAKPPHPAYDLYKDNLTAAFEELLIRAADAKAGMRVLDPEEQALIPLLSKAWAATAGTEVVPGHRPDDGTRHEGDAKDVDLRFASKSATDSLVSGEDEDDKSKAEKDIVPTILLNKVETHYRDLQELSEKMKSVDKLLSTIPDAATRDNIAHEWRAHRAIVEDNLITLSAYEQFLGAANDWKGGKMDPDSFSDVLNRLFLHKKEGDPDAVDVGALIGMTDGEWRQANVATRVQKALEFKLNPLLKPIEEHMDGLDKDVPKIRENLDDLQRAYDASNAVPARGLKSVIGLEFYSINQVIESVKNVVDSFSKAWGNWHQLKVGKLSNQMGTAIAGTGFPFSDQAKMTLELELDHKDDEVKDSFEKHLDHDLASFHHMVDPHHGILFRNQRDGNRFRGCIEYMASKGWLYDLDIENRMAFGIRLKPGETLPAQWSEDRVKQYIRDLDDKNSKGQDGEDSRGYSRVDSKPDIPPMIEVLEDEMNRQNYWAIKGIVRRAIEKGKEGETSAWLSTVILSYLRGLRRDHGMAAKYFPKDLMDQLGNIGIESPAWLTTFFKLNRNPLEAYQMARRDGKPFDFRNAGQLAQATVEVEEDIVAAQAECGEPPLPRAKLDRLVAKVLATHTVQLGPWKRAISIYNEKYNFFREKIAGTETTIKPEKCDDDFYNDGNGGSEVQLMGDGGFRAILRTDTTGRLQAPTKARYFMDQLIFRAQDLRKHGLRSELKKFLEETQKKMDAMFVTEWNHANSTNLIGLISRHSKPIDGVDMPVIIDLWRHNIITDEAFKRSQTPLGKEAQKWLKEKAEKGIVVTQQPEYVHP